MFKIGDRVIFETRFSGSVYSQINGYSGKIIDYGKLDFTVEFDKNIKFVGGHNGKSEYIDNWIEAEEGSNIIGKDGHCLFVTENQIRPETFKDVIKRTLKDLDNGSIT